MNEQEMIMNEKIRKREKLDTIRSKTRINQ